MNSGPVVSSSSALIALTGIGQLSLLEMLFGSVVIQPAVRQETSSSIELPAWVTEEPLTQAIGPQILRAALGAGESEAIALALEFTARCVILDDRPARRLAEALGLPVIGTLGILLDSKRRGFLSAVRPGLDDLVAGGFRVAPDLYSRVLSDAGEA